MPASTFDWVQVVPWAIALAGLLVAHVFSEARERRKEFRSLLDKLAERLSKLEESGREFHTAAAYNETLARKIDAEVSRIERIVSRVLPGRLTSEIIEHRRALTLENFDKDGFQQQSLSSDIVAGIDFTTIDYEEALEREYRLRYPATFPFYQVVHTEETGLGNLTFAMFAGGLIGAVSVYLATR